MNALVKSEIRNSKSEENPKAEAPTPGPVLEFLAHRLGPVGRTRSGPELRISGFGFRSDFGLRISDLLPALVLVLVLVFVAPAARAADTTRIKLATLAPTGSSFYKSLQNLREAWKKASNGSVDLIIYGDGKLGGETDTVGLMGVNSVQAAMLTAVGLGEIEAGVEGLQSIPMGFRDLAAVDYVGQKLQPMLEEKLLKKGFVVLFWTDAGWVRFFTKKPVTTPDDLRKLKLFAWAGNPNTLEIYKSAGFNPVPLETADIVPGLQTGLIEAVPLPPGFALATQIDTRAPYMLEVNWGALVGALVIRKQTWDKIPEALRTELRLAAVTAGAEIKAASRKEGVEAVKAMEKRGLKVTQVAPEVVAVWHQAAEKVWGQIRGKIVPADIYDQALTLIQEYEAAHPAPGK
jgi:TRAP-type C4-dicarboxylate transport system substrate-binding protein